MTEIDKINILDDIEKNILDNVPELYLDTSEEIEELIKTFNIEEFIIWFLKEGNINLDTRSLNGALYCDNGRYRSLGDIYRICQYYFKNITLLEVLEVIFNIHRLGSWICGDIGKRIYFYQREYLPGSTIPITLNSLENKYDEDEYETTISTYLELIE